MSILYDYLTLEGDTNWYVAPAAVVSTKYVDAVRTSNGSSSGLTGAEVVAAATATSVSNVSTESAPAKHAVVKKVSATPAK